MFDRSLLPPARLEFVIMTDTHYMIDPGQEAVEFENRRLQSARAAVAYAQIAGLKTPFVVHLGDLVQTFPGRPDFAQAVDEAQAQIAGFGLDLRLAPGNHDVGDKPDPTMPTEWATAESLAAHHARFGRSWFSWDWEDLHFVVLNSQIMNTDLPEAQEQAAWAEAELTQHADRRQYLFLHMPPYLYTAQESSLGHYDNLAQPARGWLLALAQRTGVELMCAAHVHFGFYDWIPHRNQEPEANAATPLAEHNAEHIATHGSEQGIRYFVTPSPAFTRPGFSELFSGSPPDQQGRNDTPKLGFFLARVHEDGTRLHFLRTGGATTLPEVRGDRLLTRHPRDLPNSPLGVYLRHPLAKVGDVPVAWPSVIRQRVRNDYPLLLAQELGVRHLRFPVDELHDDFQRARLALARQEGASLTATVLWPPDQNRTTILAHAQTLLNGPGSGIEVQMPEALLPSDDCLAWLRELDGAGIAVTLAPLQPHYTVAGKQHSRTQLGYTPAELTATAPTLAGYGLPRLRALCVVRTLAEMWDAVTSLAESGLPEGLDGVDWLIPPAEEGGADVDIAQTAWAAQALFMAAALPGTRVYFDPWMDLDRTMDSPHGLIDRSCNPRPAFHALKTLNTVLYAHEGALQLQKHESHAAGQILYARRGEQSLVLLTPAAGNFEWQVKPAAIAEGAGWKNARRYHLGLGSVEPLGDPALSQTVTEPTVLVN